MGKASSYTFEVADEICRRISEGEPLKQICRDVGMPAWRTVYDWLNKYPEFAAAMEEARQLGARAIAEECLEIADDSRNDFIVRINQKTGAAEEAFYAEHVQRSKLRIETRLKLLSKWHPKEYGEKIQQEISGSLGITKAHELTDDDLATIASAGSPRAADPAEGED